MALQEYVGLIILEVNGQDVEIESFSVTQKTGRKLVKTMNRSGRAKGFSKGIEEFDIKATAVIPLTGDIDWAAIEGAKLSIYPQSEGGTRVSYLDCFTIEVGASYKIDGEAMQDITLAALRKVEE